MDVLLKSPRAFAKSTRGPSLFKNNYSWTLISTNNPLSFFKIGPAVQVSSFCELDPGINVYLRLGHWFLRKTPWNLVFLAEKPLNVVFSLENVF